MKLLLLLLLLFCASQTIPAHGHLLRNSDKNHVKDETTSFNHGHRRHGILPQSHRRSLQDEALPISPSDMPSNVPSDQPSYDVWPFNTGCDPDWEQKFQEYNRTRKEVWVNPICYSYVYVRSCFCPPEYTRPVRIVVYNDTVVHTKYIDDPNATVIDEQLETMNSLFAGLERNCFEGCPNVGATYCYIEYNNVTGNIEQVFIDQSKMIADEEVVSMPRMSLFNKRKLDLYYL